jgi:hypothetical protein
MRTTPAALLAALLWGCGQPVPADKAGYVGEWQERKQTMYLLITQDGSIRYKRLKGGASTSIEAPLRSFEGDDFHVGVGPFTTRFVVSTPPYQDKDGWRMVVDGVELERTAR